METSEINFTKKKRFYKRRWFKILITLLLIIFLVGTVFIFKTGTALNKISLKGNLLKSLVQSLPGSDSKLKGEDDGRINVALLGMRGENVPGGGLLSDTIIVLSIKPAENKVAMISVPRDLWVDNEVWNNKTKINAVYAAGEENGKKTGIEEMKKILSDASGVTVDYGIAINFEGFKELIDSLGGIDINLSEPFTESVQFNEPRVCDNNVFTVPNGEYQQKKTKTRSGKIKVVKSYPLCYPDPKYVECGGNFTLPAGNVNLNGEKALCYVRSRYTSNDFERAKRQQIVLQAIKSKALSVGTLTDFSKISGVLNALGNNVRTDMETWELKRFFDIYQKMNSPQVIQDVLDNSEDGLLYSQESKETGYILLPKGDNFDRIHDLFANIFNK